MHNHGHKSKKREKGEGGVRREGKGAGRVTRISHGDPAMFGSLYLLYTIYLYV
jgi:hypothetical protein